MGHNSSGSRELAILTAAERKLATCTEFDEVLDIRDEAETVRLFAQKQRLGLQLQNQAAKIKIQAERRLGEALGKMRLRGGDRKSKSHRTTLISRLKDLEINRSQSARWQLEASAPNGDFLAYCSLSEQRLQEISTSGFLRFIRAKQGGNLRQVARTKSCPCNERQAEAELLRPRSSAPTAICEACVEIRGHLDSLSRIFGAICEKNSVCFAAAELRLISRYFREAMDLLDDIERLACSR